MTLSMRRYRDSRRNTVLEGLEPMPYREWLLGRIAGRMMTKAALLATKRADFKSVNAYMLAIWVGNLSDGGMPIHMIPPHELAQAISTKRLNLLIKTDPRQTV